MLMKNDIKKKQVTASELYLWNVTSSASYIKPLHVTKIHICTLIRRRKMASRAVTSERLSSGQPMRPYWACKLYISWLFSCLYLVCFHLLFHPTLLPLISKLISAHHLEGCLNSVKSIWRTEDQGEGGACCRRDEQGRTGVSFAEVFCNTCDVWKRRDSWNAQTMAGAGLSCSFCKICCARFPSWSNVQHSCPSQHV